MGHVCGQAKVISLPASGLDHYPSSIAPSMNPKRGQMFRNYPSLSDLKSAPRSIPLSASLGLSALRPRYPLQRLPADPAKGAGLSPQLPSAGLHPILITVSSLAILPRTLPDSDIPVIQKDLLPHFRFLSPSHCTFPRHIAWCLGAGPKEEARRRTKTGWMISWKRKKQAESHLSLEMRRCGGFGRCLWAVPLLFRQK